MCHRNLVQDLLSMKYIAMTERTAPIGGGELRSYVAETTECDRSRDVEDSELEVICVKLKPTN